MLKAILFVGGRLLAAGVAAIAAAFDVSGESVLGLDTDGIRIVAVVAGVVFVLLTLAREMQLALAPRPRLKFTSLAPATSDDVFRGTRTDASGATIGTQTQKVGHFVRFEFMNTAEAEGQQSVAGHLHARIRILEGKTQIGEWGPGRWANTKHPESPEEIWELNRFDLGPNGEKVMLDIGVRYEGDPRFYAWHNAALIRGRFTPEQRWSGEEYVVEVELGANNMKRQTFRFTLRNPQEENEAKLILLRRKGILRKWSEVSNG